MLLKLAISRITDNRKARQLGDRLVRGIFLMSFSNINVIGYGMGSEIENLDIVCFGIRNRGI
jgi:hypothetical protein